LATDMSNHIAECQKLDMKPEEHPFTAKTEGERQELVNVVIHASDLSGQVLKLSVARQWEDRITKEFAKQAQEEEKRGLTVLPFMKNLDNPQVRAQNQVNFIDFVLIPWWKPFVKCFPSLKHCFANLISNRSYYYDIWKKDSPDSKDKKVETPTKKESSDSSSCSSSSSSSVSSSVPSSVTSSPASSPPPKTHRISVVIPNSTNNPPIITEVIPNKPL